MQRVTEAQKTLATRLRDPDEIESICFMSGKLQPSNLDESRLLDIKEDYAVMKEAFGGSNFKLLLIYRGSRDGFLAKQFHAKCDNMGPLLTLVKADATKEILGGYTSVGWHKPVTYTYQFQQDRRAFLVNVTDKEVYNLQCKDDLYAVCQTKQGHHVIFGCGHDLRISENQGRVMGYSTMKSYGDCSRLHLGQ